MPGILVADTIASEGLDILRTAGEVRVATGLSEQELVALVPEFEALVVRSATQVTAPVIEAGRNLRVIARAGVGVDNVDVPSATRRGILVVNSPGGNTLAAAEHTVAMMLAAARMIPQGDHALKEGRWERKGLMGRQVSGKTLGIVGMGKIGTEVAKRARALGMRVIVHDPYVTPAQAQALGVSLDGLNATLSQADFVTLHTPLNAQTRRLIGPDQLALMKRSAVLINCARGGLIDEEALAARLRAGELAGAALDVFEDEPNPLRELVELPNVIATPHLGASTHEAQITVAVDVAEQVVDVLSGRQPRWPVNVPALSPEALAATEPLLPLARALGRLQHALWPAAVTRVELGASADLKPEHLSILTQHFLVSLLGETVDEPVNYVNVRALAEERGIEVAEASLGADRGYSRLLEAVVTGTSGARAVSGALLGPRQARIVSIEGYSVDIVPSGPMLLIWNTQPDQPGFVGRFGTLVGAAGVNILSMQTAPEVIGGAGLMVVSLGGEVSDALLADIGKLPGVGRTAVANGE